MMLRYVCIALTLIATLGAQPRAFLPLSVDYAVFNTVGTGPYVEVYISCLQSSLKYEKDSDGSVARFNVNLELKAEDEEPKTLTENLMSRVESEEDIREGSELRHVVRLSPEPGEYNLRVALTDAVSGKSGEFLTSMEVRPLNVDSLEMSDIQFGSKIEQAQQESLFSKNGLRVVPNSSSVFSITMPVMYYYAELYNLPFDPEKESTYTLESLITDREGEVVKSFPVKKSRKPGTSAVLAGGHNIVTLPSDTYFLKLRITDDETGQKIERTKRFFLFKPTKEQLVAAQQGAANTNDMMSAYYVNLTEEELDEEFNKARYIARPEEESIYDGLDQAGKVQFLVEFWNRRDTDRTTRGNEFKRDYLQLVEYASNNFTTKFTNGWKSDRGRVLLTYGSPNDVERSPMERGSKPYEIWSYDELEGGSIFVFGDLRGFGDYELIHSTYSKELYQPDWERQILRRRNETDFDPIR
ncbi:MAG: GWxTD domain-containing protein [Calditrichota bacterium]